MDTPRHECGMVGCKFKINHQKCMCWREVGLRAHNFVYYSTHVQDDPKLLGDSGEVPISEWSGWRFDSRCEIFSLLDRGKLTKQVGNQQPTHRKVGSKPHPAPKRFLSRVAPTDSNCPTLVISWLIHPYSIEIKKLDRKFQKSSEITTTWYFFICSVPWR